jgi:electron transfer flavoprotein beta subunit
MHVIVCVKQVPDTTNVRINPETNTLVREGVESIINPYDEYALEEALKLKDKYDARVTVISMGPPQADVVLREALARGADDAVLLTDRAFAGADTWATSYALAQAIKKINPNPDIVFFGKQFPNS